MIIWSTQSRDESKYTINSYSRNVTYVYSTRIPVTKCACMQSIPMYNGCPFHNSLSSLPESLQFKFMLQWHNEVHWRTCMSVHTLRELCGRLSDKQWWKLEWFRQKWQEVIEWTAIVLKLRMLCKQAELVAGFLVYDKYTLHFLNYH